MLKNDLRLKYSQLRESTSLKQISKLSILIANAALKLPIWKQNYYHIFLPIIKKKEVDTEGLISIILGNDKNLVVPKMISNTNLEHYLLTDNTKLKPNTLGVLEPVEGIIVHPNKIDVVFIPLLAFDLLGNRVGYGKGYYDKFLQQCKKETIKIGLSLFEAEEELISDVSSNDVRLDYCITPSKIYSFSSS